MALTDINATATVDITVFPAKPDPKPPVAKVIARQLVDFAESEINRRIGEHRDHFRTLWYNDEATPQQIADEMGTSAGLFFGLAQVNVQGVSAAANLIGKTLDDFMSPDFYTSPKTVTVNADGTVTIGD